MNSNGNLENYDEIYFTERDTIITIRVDRDVNVPRSKLSE